MIQPRAYEGNEPYIFVSYAHKDSNHVLPIITSLQAQGFRVWYDAGIEAGTEWPEYIAGRLDGCAVFFGLYFRSRSGFSKLSPGNQFCHRTAKRASYHLHGGCKALSWYANAVGYDAGSVP